MIGPPRGDVHGDRFIWISHFHAFELLPRNSEMFRQKIGCVPVAADDPTIGMVENDKVPARPHHLACGHGYSGQENYRFDQGRIDATAYIAEKRGPLRVKPLYIPEDLPVDLGTQLQSSWLMG